jgi:hypothetical protein
MGYGLWKKDGKAQYVFMFDFPAGKLALTKLPLSKTATVQMQGSHKKLKWKNVSGGVEIEIPSALKAVTDYV